MRTEAVTKDVVIKIPTKARYQFDDNLSPETPHLYEWRGILGQGATKAEALKDLGYQCERKTHFVMG